MANPAKILAFLDLAGAWDPSLVLVMGGAIAVGLVAFAIARRRTASALGVPMQLPTSRAIDARLVGGSVLFGIGWGLAGFCPGPAIVALGAGYAKAGIPEKLRTRMYDTPHEFNAAMQAEAWEWLRKWV